MARPKAGVTFWDRVYKNTIISDSGCHQFIGHKDECGYGRIYKDGKLVRVHREVWKLHNPGKEIEGVIMHSCDNPGCINPDHLSHGTQNDNIKDMQKKGRGARMRGTQQTQAKLKEELIPIIRERLSNGEGCAAISRDYGVSDAAIRRIKFNRGWVHC